MAGPLLKLLNELAVINQHLSKLLQFQPQAKTQPSPDQNEEQGKKKSAHRRVHIDEMVPIDLAQDIKDEYKTANNQTTTNNNKQLFWARVSAGLIFIYAGVTFLMYLANRDAANGGWLAYRDAFPGSAPHLTEFCNRMESVRLRPTGELEISWTLCNSHNCVDKSCKDYDDLAKFAPEL